MVSDNGAPQDLYFPAVQSQDRHQRSENHHFRRERESHTNRVLASEQELRSFRFDLDR